MHYIFTSDFKHNLITFLFTVPNNINSFHEFEIKEVFTRCVTLKYTHYVEAEHVRGQPQQIQMCQEDRK